MIFLVTLVAWSQLATRIDAVSHAVLLHDDFIPKGSCIISHKSSVGINEKGLAGEKVIKTCTNDSVVSCRYSKKDVTKAYSTVIFASNWSNSMALAGYTEH